MDNYSNFYAYAQDHPELNTIEKSVNWMSVIFEKIASKREAKLREVVLERAREKKLTTGQLEGK